MVYVAAGTWHEIQSEWFRLTQWMELFGLSMVGESGSNHEISEYNFLLHTNCFSFPYVQLHIKSNGLRTKFVGIGIAYNFHVIRFRFGKKCGCSNRSIAFIRLFYFNPISAVHVRDWRVLCRILALMAEATAIWHLSHFSLFVFAPVVNIRGGKLNEN